MRMSRRIGVVASTVNAVAVALFAVFMLCGINFGSYLSSVFIALSYVTMACAFADCAKAERRLAGLAAVAFAAVYTAIILLVYFAQLTVVRSGNLTEQAGELLDFQRMGLMFHYDLLGYGLMSLSTLFAGLTVEPRGSADKWLRSMLCLHGVFFVPCLVVPMLGVFQADGSPWIGIALLEFWCVYFCPVGILSALHFSKRQ